MALVINTGSNSFSYLKDGIPQPKADKATVVAKNTAISVVSPYGTEKIPMDGTTVNGVPFTAASNINTFYDALAPVVLTDKAAGSGGAGGSSTVTDPSGAPVALPLTVTLTDGTERIVGMQGVALPRSISWDIVSGDTVTIKYRYSATGTWRTLGAYTVNGEDSLTKPIQAYSIQRTAGTGTTSIWTVS